MVSCMVLGWLDHLKFVTSLPVPYFVPSILVHLIPKARKNATAAPHNGTYCVLVSLHPR